MSEIATTTPARANLVFSPGVTLGAWLRGKGKWKPPADRISIFRRHIQMQFDRTLPHVPLTIDECMRRYRWQGYNARMRIAHIQLNKRDDACNRKLARRRYRWQVNLSDCTSKERLHPTFWFLVFPLPVPKDPGGVLVIPDCVIPPHWHIVRLAQRPYWMWQYWGRWDCLKTYPDLPEDLLRYD